jgi:hypothetical protein
MQADGASLRVGCRDRPRSADSVEKLRADTLRGGFGRSLTIDRMTIVDPGRFWEVEVVDRRL